MNDTNSANASKDYELSCCSTVDLTAELLDKLDVAWVPFHYELDGVDHPDDLGQSMPFKEFYAAMTNGAETKTSQVNVEQYVEHFERLLESNPRILHVCLSSGLSGSYNSACVAADMVMESHPDAQITVVDSLGASSGYGLIMNTLAERRAAGMGYEELCEWIEENRLKMHHWFFSTDLTFYIKGGRVSKTSGFFGTALHICPLLNMDNVGGLVPREKIRSKSKTMAATLDKMVEHAQGGLDYSGKVFISHSDCLEDAQKLAKMIEEKFPNLDGPVQITYIGTTIGSHTGPGTVALFFWGDERVD